MSGNKENYYEIKITQCIDGREITSTQRVDRYDVNISDYIEMFKRVSLCAGWSEELINEELRE